MYANLFKARHLNFNLSQPPAKQQQALLELEVQQKNDLLKACKLRGQLLSLKPCKRFHTFNSAPTNSSSSYLHLTYKSTRKKHTHRK